MPTRGSTPASVSRYRLCGTTAEYLSRILGTTTTTTTKRHCLFSTSVSGRRWCPICVGHRRCNQDSISVSISISISISISVSNLGRFSFIFSFNLCEESYRYVFNFNFMSTPILILISVSIYFGSYFNFCFDVNFGSMSFV